MRRRGAGPRRGARLGPGTGQGGPRRTGVVMLAYARDRRGALVAAASLDAASRRSRAPFACPACGDEVVARLGPVRARHYAHRPGSACPLTAPETALHFNAKARLLELCALAFAGRGAVLVWTRCEACRQPVRRDLASAGDAAAMEGPVAGRRADVLVCRGSAPALALEVRVTHRVDTGKAAALLAAGLPAVEVDARAAWEVLTPEGVIEISAATALGLPPCRACRMTVRAEGDRSLGGEAAQVAELESYRALGLLEPDAGPSSDGDKPVRHDRVKFRIGHGISAPDPESFGDYSGSGGDERAASSLLGALATSFECPDCGGSGLRLGARLATHACPGQGDRPLAWVGYDGRLAVLRWWKKVRP